MLNHPKMFSLQRKGGMHTVSEKAKQYNFSRSIFLRGL